MNKKPYPKILDAVVHDQIRADLNLTPQIMSRIQKRNKNTMKPQTKLFTAVLLVLMFFAVLFFAVPGVAAAIQGWFGYVPGIGLVREGQIRVLAAPVSVTRDGITVTVEQVVLESSSIKLTFKEDGIPDSALVHSNPPDFCKKGMDPILRFPNLELNIAEPLVSSGAGGSYQYKVTPPSANDAVFVLPCLQNVRPGAAPEDWEIPLHFIPAPPEMTVFPVIEIPMPTKPAATQAAPQTPASDAGISLTLDRAVQMDDGYLIYATIHWPAPNINGLDLLSPTSSIHLRDASGREMLYEMVDDENIGMKSDQRQTVFALKTAPVESSGPLSIVVDSVSVDAPTEDATFIFDPGPNPQPGQSWQLNQDVQVGKYSMRVLSVSTDGTGYMFDIQSTSGITSVLLSDKNDPPMGGGGSGGDGISTQFSTGFSYDHGLPAGPITVSVDGMTVRREGPWQAEWVPPAASTKVFPTRAMACLTTSSWQKAIREKPAVPQGLGGKIILSSTDAGSGETVISISNLDGSNRQAIKDARDAAFSPDGSKLAYSSLRDAIYIMDLATGQSTQLPGTVKFDFNPQWSLDGSQIVFMRGAPGYDLYIVNLDGSGLRALTNGGRQEWPLGWMPDGKHLLYSTAAEEAVSYLLNIQTGESQLLPLKNIATVSPDGKHVITQEKIFGDRWALYFSDLDGSNRWSLADPELWASSPTFSPDGQWLILSVSDVDYLSTIATLVHLDDCQIIPLPNIKGDANAWIPTTP